MKTTLLEDLEVKKILEKYLAKLLDVDDKHVLVVERVVIEDNSAIFDYLIVNRVWEPSND